MCVEIRIYQKHIVKLRTILPMSFSLKFWNFGPRLGQPFSNKGGPFYPQNIPLYEGEIKIFLFSKNWACWTKSIGNLGAKRKDNKLHTFPKNILWFSAYYILINLCVIKITLSTKIRKLLSIISLCFNETFNFIFISSLWKWEERKRKEQASWKWTRQAMKKESKKVRK